MYFEVGKGIFISISIPTVWLIAKKKKDILYIYIYIMATTIIITKKQKTKTKSNLCVRKERKLWFKILTTKQPIGYNWYILLLLLLLLFWIMALLDFAFELCFLNL